MSKMKKVVISILLSLIMLCGLHTVSNANLVLDSSRVFKNVGDVNFIYKDEHHRSKALWCAQRREDHHGANYKAISKVTIVGRKATDYKGNVWESDWNLILGRILWEESTETERIPWKVGGVWLNQPWPTVAYGVWYALPKWMSAMEKANTLVRDTNGRTTLLKSNFADGAGTAPGKLAKIAEEYAKNYKGDGTGITDNTNYEKLNKQLIINKDSKNSKESDTYLRVGPFNWTFAGKITDIKLYNEKEKEITGTSFICGDSVKDIISNKDFYILMPMQDNMEKVTIKAEQEVEQKEVTIWFLEKMNAQTQNLIGREIRNIPASGETEFEFDLLGTLKFKKVDKDTGEPLAGVGFKIKQKNGYYIKVNEEKEITGKATVKNISAVSKSSEATTFITDENGMVEIDDIYGGTYVVIEKKIDMYGYKKDGVQEEITVVSGKNAKNASEIKIENEKKTGLLEILKIDKDTKKPLAGVEFKIQRSDGKYIRVPDAVDNKVQNIKVNGKVKPSARGENIKYTSDASKATIFITDEDGKVDILNILEGTYTPVEIKANNGYLTAGKVEAVTVQRISAKYTNKVYVPENLEIESGKITIENERKTGLLEILKIDKDTKKPLAGVEFKIQRYDGNYIYVPDAVDNRVQNTKVNGKVKPSTRGENIQYTSDINSATVFVTDEDGKVDILNIVEGTYTPVEIKTNRGYVLAEDVKSVTVKKIDEKYVNSVYVPEDLEIESGKLTVENERRTGLLEILKIDKDTEKPLAGVEFKIQRSDGNYIYVPDVANNRVQNTKVGTNVKPSVRGENIQYTSDVNSATVFVTDEDGKVDILNIEEGTYTPVEIKPNRGYALAEDVESVTVKKIDAKYVDSEYVPDVEIESGKITVKNEKTTGDLKIIKKDADAEPELRLAGIGFKLKTEDGYIQLKNAQGEIQTQITGTYSIEDANRDIITNATKETATEFITDTNGEIYVANILVGEYTVEETSLGENAKYYDIISDDGQPVHEVVVVKRPTEAEPWTEVTLKNKRKYLDLWGYVWVNGVPDDKDTPGVNQGENSLYHGTAQDNNDQLFSGIEVRLKDRTTNETVATMVTGKVANSVLNVEEGHYYFEKVSIDKLQDYYIEFEYDGLTYESSPARVDKSNGSKALEGENRTEFNNKFSVVEGPQSGEGSNIGHAGNLTLNYSIDNATGNERAKATLQHNNDFVIQSDTDKVYNGGIDKMQVLGNNSQFYTPDYIRKNAVTEVPDINLGLFRRDQPDLRIAKDIKNVKLTINDKSHVYNYSQVLDDGTDNLDQNNVGVVFGSKNNPVSYYRAIYEADLNYDDPNKSDDKNNELEVYVTYQIKIYNDANVIVKVNSIADYADARYQLEKIGTTYNKDTGDIENNVNSNDMGISGSYHKYVIDTNVVVNANKSANLYVQFKLNRDNLIDIFGQDGVSKEDLENVAEINSYSPLNEDGTPYAGIDIDSNPGNCVPLKYNGGDSGLAAYEDDTDISQPLKLVINGPRKISGTVFIDNADEIKLQNDQIREGNGELDDGEVGVEGVVVTLTEKSGSGKSYTETTNKDGNFTIKDYIPGDYELTYTWGEQTYTLDGEEKKISVQDYKGTIYDEARYNENYGQDDQNGNTKWYKGTNYNDSETRYTDAVDDWVTRQQIDKEIQIIYSGTNSEISIKEMDSTTPKMDIGVELDDFNDEQKGVSYANEINNVDFGIIERAKQEVSMSKRIESIKVTLANGQVLADLTIDENGTLNGESRNVAYVQPSQTGNGPWNTKHGFAKIELDNELLQGTVVEVGYIITAKNSGEIDYGDKGFQYHGSAHEVDKSTIVKITNLDIIDYLDRDWGYDSDKNSGWAVKEKTDLDGRVKPEVLGTEDSREDGQVTKINERLILEQKLEGIDLAPGDEKSIKLTASKIVTTSSEINLDNETEIIEIDKTGGSRPTSIPGNYIPGTGHTEPDDAVAERTIVAPSTGGDQNYIIPILIGTTLLVILGTGVIFIKKKIIKSDD